MEGTELSHLYFEGWLVLRQMEGKAVDREIDQLYLTLNQSGKSLEER
jgi:hypothetical protein